MPHSHISNLSGISGELQKFGSAAEQVRRERGGETAEEELKRLRREVTQLKQERDVLKKSVAVFARDRS